METSALIQRIKLDHGMVKPSDDPDTRLAVVVFLSIALYNVIELAFIIYASFKKRSGIYFWSFVVATCGILPNCIAWLLKCFGVNPSAAFVYATMIVVGWVCMVTGQSIVLYSRLHLVDHDPSHLRFVLAMIITNVIVSHVPVIIMVYGINSTHAELYASVYSVYAKVTVTLFFVQEVVISGLYIFATVRLFRDSIWHAKSARQRMVRHLVIMNIIIVLLDITILGLEYSGHYQLQTAYKGMAYSIKLKIEFRILNGLVDLASQGGRQFNLGRRLS
ncbi:hypothetical protein EDB81DRAFT_669302 [Dactylonectria macrodidyma]|uniref:DUF7703 domain-containing protein n=1 Tax=Dactylonectria macrodidyma TaxID=307937 RepID=A0A9P9D8U1_9HYPO|nr:hypothetical protein EDB81DRAFT_669302 [Dactylonectria macrodidyma]